MIPGRVDHRSTKGLSLRLRHITSLRRFGEQSKKRETARSHLNALQLSVYASPWRYKINHAWKFYRIRRTSGELLLRMVDACVPVNCYGWWVLTGKLMNTRVFQVFSDHTTTFNAIFLRVNIKSACYGAKYDELVQQHYHKLALVTRAYQRSSICCFQQIDGLSMHGWKDA